MPFNFLDIHFLIWKMRRLNLAVSMASLSSGIFSSGLASNVQDWKCLSYYKCNTDCSKMPVDRRARMTRDATPCQWHREWRNNLGKQRSWTVKLRIASSFQTANKSMSHFANSSKDSLSDRKLMTLSIPVSTWVLPWNYWSFPTCHPVSGNPSSILSIIA